MKKFVSTLMAVCILSSTLFAYANDQSTSAAATETITEAETTEPKEAIVYELTLDKAIEMAYENNPQLEANKYDCIAKEIAMDTAILQKQNYRNTEKSANKKGLSLDYNVVDGFTSHCLKNGYYVDAAKVQHELAILEGEKISGSIAYNVTEAYYNYVLMQKLLKAAQNSYNLAVANMSVVNSQYSLGLIAKLDYENAALMVTTAENAVESYKLNLGIAEENLKISIHKDGENCTLRVSDDIDCSEFTSDVSADAAAAMESRYDLTALKKSKELAYRYLDLAEIGTQASSLYNDAYSSYVDADYTYTNTKKLITLLIKSTYNSIVTSKAGMNTAQLSYEMKLKEYESAKMKYDLGMITNLQLTQVINDLYDAQVAYANAKVSYKLAVEKYKYEITIGL